MERMLERMPAKHDDIAKRIRPLGFGRRENTEQAETIRPISHTTQAPFRYESLARNRTVRVIDLAPGTWDEPINCWLRTVHLDDEYLRYEAVSYAWGDPTDRKTIVCNGSVISITCSLFEALQRFRCVGAMRTLWADALCINQADDDERTSQVLLMSIIYKRAVRVLAWLQHDEAQVVQDTLNAICQFLRREDDFARKELRKFETLRKSTQIFYRWHGVDVTSFSGEGPSGTIVGIADALLRIGSSPWFGRGWVVQEVALSTSTSVFWGHAEIGFEWLGIAACCALSRWGNVLSQGALNCYSLYRSSRNSGSAQHSFVSLMYWASIKKFSEPKDRIYGLLGLKTLECDPADGKSFVNPDYGITTVQCYRRVAGKLLCEWHDFRVLSWAGKRSEIAEDWPSWVPDLNDSNTVFFGFRDLANKHLEGPRNAHLTSISETVNDGNHCVEISGLRVDIADQEVKEYVDLELRYRNPEATTSLQAVLRTLEHKYGDHVIACTLGNWYKFLPLDSVRIANFLSEYRTFMEKRFPVGVDPFFISGLNSDSSPSFEPSADRFFTWCWSEKPGHTLFITNTGMLCFGPEAMLPGDVVVEFHGAFVPFVLRPANDGHWRLVGECYIYEVNEGRVHREWEEKGSVSEKFCIC